jgi:uncharacterized OB-fold protein
MGRIHTDDPEAVRPGVDVELVVEPVKRDEEGREIVTWMFRPL